VSKLTEQLFAGIDIGGTKISVLITDGGGQVLGRAKKKSKPERGFRGVMDRTAATVAEACDAAGVSIDNLKAAGVGAPSPILPDGTAIHATNMGWRNVPLAASLTERLSMPVFAENDCNAGTYGEYSLGKKQHAGTLIGLFMGTGLGGGMVMDGKLINGDNSMAAEIGHMTVNVDGRPCGCGKRGCLEAYASKTGMAYSFKEAILLQKRESILPKLMEDSGYDNVRSSLLKRAWDEKDDVVREALQQAARYLGVAAGNLITLLGPETIVFGGGVFDALGKELLPLVKEATKQHAFPPESLADTSIELARLGDDAVALGAMAYARSQLVASA
jgi:glucokinase